MDSELDWTLPDAQYVCQKEVLAVTRDESDAEAASQLRKKGLMFTHSLEIINKECRVELTQYRIALATYKSEEQKQAALSQLYSKYRKQMNKNFFSRLLGL